MKKDSDYVTGSYSFIMPEKSVKITGTAIANPTVTYEGGSRAAVSGFTSGGKIRPGTVVNFKLTATADYYWPTASSTDVGLAEISVKKTTDYESGLYRFTMPTKAVKISGTAIDNPTVTISKGANVTEATVSAAKARPGTTITVKVSGSNTAVTKKVGWVTVTTGYNFTTPSAEGRPISLTLQGQTEGSYESFMGVASNPVNATITYTFKLGTSNETITTSAS